MGPQYNKTGSHTPQIYFWLIPENICNQQDMLHMFIHTEGAQFPPTTIYLFQKKKYYRQSKKLWLLGFVSWGPGRFGILSSLSVVFVSLPLRKSCGFWVFLTGPVFFSPWFSPLNLFYITSMACASTHHQVIAVIMVGIGSPMSHTCSHAFHPVTLISFSPVACVFSYSCYLKEFHRCFPLPEISGHLSHCTNKENG